jgi:hypothetical protein
MVKLKFISESAANTDSNERILLYDMWKILGGEQNDEILIDDAKAMIMGIARILDYRRVGVEIPPEEKEKYQNSGTVGYRDRKGKFCLTIEDT